MALNENKQEGSIFICTEPCKILKKNERKENEATRGGRGVGGAQQEPESSAGAWNSRGAWKKPGPGCAAQNGSAASRSSDRRTKVAGNAMAEQPPRSLSLVNPSSKIAPLVAGPSAPGEDENKGREA
jgi:hypothetical protein